MKKETSGYKGWLNSDCFLKRVFAVFGYNMLGNIILSIVATFILLAFAGTLIGTFGNLKINFNGDKVFSFNIGKSNNVVYCDENLVRYDSKKEALKAGLSEEQFGATFCPEYKMDPSWDTDKDGINDCYKSNSCDPEVDYMIPKK